MRVCAWCHRVLEMLPRLLGGARNPAVTHGMCRPCLEQRLSAAPRAPLSTRPAA